MARKRKRERRNRLGDVAAVTAIWDFANNHAHQVAQIAHHVWQIIQSIPHLVVSFLRRSD